MSEMSIYERFGRAIEREQQTAEALLEQQKKTQQVAAISSQVLQQLKSGELTLDQIKIEENGSWEVIPKAE